MDLEEQLHKYLSDPSLPVDPNWVSEVLAAHPTFAIAVALLLRQGQRHCSNIDSQSLISKMLMAAPDPTAMADFADLSGSDWAHFYPAAEPAAHKSTLDTIDTFLSAYGDPNSPDDALLEKLIFNPVAPYELTEEALEENSNNSQAASTQTPEETLPAMHTISENEPVPAPEEPLFMESLAKIFIKQRRYERAFEIIKNISLKNPEKSAYFADQLRFLQKLINNQRYKSASQL